MGDETKNRHLGWLRVLGIFIPYIIFLVVFQLIGYLITGADIYDINFEKTSEQKLIINFFSLIGTFFVLWLFMKYVNKEPFIKLGFQTKNRLKDFIVGILIGAALMASGYVFLLLLEEIHFERILFDIKEIIISILFFIMVAIAEEVMFRGYVLKNLMVSFNKYVALIVSSILFALMHGLNPNIDLFSLTNLFLCGILLGLSYIYTKNLWFPIALHLSWNLFQTMFGFNVSGQDTYSLIEFSINENNMLNGGAFGFEGSILSIIFELAVIISIGVFYTRKKTLNNS